jgi:hypothetical protein
MAAALAVVHRAPAVARPVLRAAAFNAFGVGFTVACMVGAGVAVAGALYSFRFLPGRSRTATGVTVAAPGAAGAVDPADPSAALPLTV